MQAMIKKIGQAILIIIGIALIFFPIRMLYRTVLSTNYRVIQGNVISEEAYQVVSGGRNGQSLNTRYRAVIEYGINANKYYIYGSGQDYSINSFAKISYNREKPDIAYLINFKMILLNAVSFILGALTLILGLMSIIRALPSGRAARNDINGPETSS
jgi:hypothetical protein